MKCPDGAEQKAVLPTFSPELWLDRYLVARWLPEAECGRWGVVRHVIAGDRAEWLRAHDPRCGLTPPGVYTMLYEVDYDYIRQGWMNDFPAEMLEAERFVDAAYGTVHISGLGMGLLPSMLVQKPSIRRVDIVERSSEVIRLVGTCLQRLSDKTRIFSGNALTWNPIREGAIRQGERYDFAYHDIWLRRDASAAQVQLQRFRPFVASQSAWM